MQYTICPIINATSIKICIDIQTSFSSLSSDGWAPYDPQTKQLKDAGSYLTGSCISEFQLVFCLGQLQTRYVRHARLLLLKWSFNDPAATVAIKGQDGLGLRGSGSIVGGNRLVASTCPPIETSVWILTVYPKKKNSRYVLVPVESLFAHFLWKIDCTQNAKFISWLLLRKYHMLQTNGGPDVRSGIESYKYVFTP